MLNRRSFLGALSAFCSLVAAKGVKAALPRKHRELHVSLHGDDAHHGSASSPLRTISAAAALSFPGDTITVHQGIYRERIAPPRGGLSDAQRITYRAAPGELVEISGAEVVTGWVNLQQDVWKLILPNSFFGAFNPYSDLIHGDWFDPMKRLHHTGAVYLNGDWLAEAAQLDDVLKPAAATPLWFGQVNDTTTTLWAQFPGVDPNRQTTEINVRQTVFYPEKPGINYITVRGFTLRQAATPWAPPTAEQIGLIGTHWSKGWIIENNIVRHSICSGISLGKYGDQFDNQSHNSANGYVETIQRALQSGWSRENIGSHIVRGNTISHCEQTGIVGSLGAVFSTITGNSIHDIHVRRLFSGAEIAGIKFHAAIDTEISHNVICRCYRGMWLDWMAQGTRVSANLFAECAGEDLFVEVNHGPFVVDNNIFLSKTSLRTISQGGAFVHNLICGNMTLERLDSRETPFMKPHSTQIAGLHNNPSGDLRFYNNLVAQAGDLTPLNQTLLPTVFDGNVFVAGAKPSSSEPAPLLQPGFDPAIHLTQNSQANQLDIILDPAWAAAPRKLITSAILGLAAIPNLPFERPDATPIRVDTDFSGRPRNPANPFPGPFERPQGGKQSIPIPA